MDLNWVHTIIYGFVSGFADIVPVSAQAHKVLLLKFFGASENVDLLNLLIRLSIFGALFYCSQTHLTRIRRARALARVPKRKRKRPLDTRSLMDWSLLKTMAVPVILGAIIYQYMVGMQTNLMLITVFLFLNGLILYLPQFLPSSNKDSRSLSRIEGLLMGLGGITSVFPGISAIGTAVSVGSVCGVEKEFCLSMALIMNMLLSACMAVYDILGIIERGIGTVSVLAVISYLFAAGASFAGAILGVRVMRYFSNHHGYAGFGIYCWGLALFTFILNLMA